MLDLPPSALLTPRNSRVLPTAALTFIFAFFASLSVAATPSAETALGLKPIQTDVEYEIPDAAAAAKCTVNDIDHPEWSGWEVHAADGTMLRRFADTNGDNKVDLWCYFNFGVEVYRDVDKDFNTKADQYRWLGTEGTRWGEDENEDGRIDRWVQISAEEVTAEVVSAMRDRDPARFARLLVSESDLKSLGLGAETSRRLATKADRAASEFTDFAKRQQAVSRSAKWVQFAAATPGVVPAGIDGSTKDVIVYENAVAMFEDGGKNGQILVGTIIKVGDRWKIVDLPSAAADGDAVAQSAGNFFTPGGIGGASAAAGSGVSSQAQELVTQLEEVDQKLAEAGDPKDVSSLHEARAQLVARLIKSTDDPGERDAWTRQLIDTVSAATQSGAYPDGLVRLKAIARSLGEENEPLRSYADYLLIGTEYAVRQTPDADFAKVQEWYLEALTDFVDQHPQMPEAAQAMLQLALSKEFEDKEKEALGYYKKVAVAFRGTEAAEKAAGAARRLESVGQVIELQGLSIEGKAFKLSQLRGRPVVIHYWATWCEPCKQDMKLLRGLQARYAKAGLQVVGVNVDATRESAGQFLKQNSVPWIQLFDDGGLESSDLAKAFGVQTLPTTMLVDQKGRMVRHNIRVDDLESELDKLTK
ncbi:TlpA disulfide reductase family protein [Novipirellula artificiosorum]|uniref:Thiol-disulfide oxidoreductase ResA n=1 Tax=Novipirellula artificiosorum TaxID=2528016 RepID=A0A5C6E171_9BACT|nr:TlpA disulfide reductase family protein [Novipirellula artificiosorum]TWU41717.1 Thiol-disulfide oxidoreductase ResA [Novipirellula artificiosorum]